MNHKHLEFLYEHWGARSGWLSYLEDHFVLSQMDIEYLIGLDEHQNTIDKRVNKWMRDIEREGGLEIYGEGDLGKKLALVNQKINTIEMIAEGLSSEDAFLYIGLSDIEALSSLRYKLRNKILLQEMPERIEAITDSEIESARTVPLWRLIEKLPKTNKILCPFHSESTPSFHVGQWGYCFGCRAHCDSIGWLMRCEGISFISAVRQLNGLG